MKIRQTKIDIRLLGVFFLLLLVLRITGVFNLYFWEEDEISLAAGIASLVRDNIGDVYRYAPQLGYYRIIQSIDLLLGGDVRLIPGIMKYLSALAGALIPIFGLFLFRVELSVRNRWLIGAILAANPIIWKSSTYGNTALVATGISLIAITLLTNRPKIVLEVTALVIFCCAVLVRADTVLLLPIIGFLLYRSHRSIWLVALRVVGIGIVLAVSYGILFLFDNKLDRAFSAVSVHFGEPRGTMFWEYLIWAISPVPLAFSILGMRSLIKRFPELSVALVVWLIPTLGFYFAATTTPRYFLLASVPISVAAAVGISDLYDSLKSRFPPVLVSIALLGGAFLHVFMGLGHFKSYRHALKSPGFVTDDRRMPTGALIYDSHFRGGFLHQSFRNAGFSVESLPYWEGPVFRKAWQVLADPERRNTTAVILNGGYWHAFHYHAQEAGAEYVSREPTDPSTPFSSETWMRLGAARIMTIALESPHFSDLKSIDLHRGDRLWLMGSEPSVPESLQEKLPTDIRLVREESFADKINIFRVEDRKN